MLKLKLMILLAVCLMSGAAAAVSAQDELPRPRLILIEKRDKEADGKPVTFYRLDVENKADFPAELFERAPDLPPCGRNANSARSWVNLYDGNGKRIYGFCNLKSPSELGMMAFIMPRNANLDKVYIVIKDRRLQRQTRSEAIPVR